MKTYKYVEPDNNMNPIVKEITEEEILQTYYPWWSNKLKELGREHLISKERCIEDWVVVNWAWEE